MSIKQVSIFVENVTGTLASTTDFLAERRVNLRALSIADAMDYGILRIICENPEETVEMLKEAGYVTKITDVFAVEISDEAGSLSRVLFELADAGVSIEYTYAFLSTKRNGAAYMIFRVDDNDKAVSVLTSKGFKLISQKEIF